MSPISTLVQDIYSTVLRKDGWFNPELASEFSSDVAERLQRQYNNNNERGTLRMSKLGPQCPKALWHSVHTPELAEPLPAPAMLKYSFGHILEAQAIMLAKAAGHRVEGEQDAVHLDGVLGHRDCIINGCIVDVKSCSSRMFGRFKDGSIRYSDNFGYLDQLDAYVVGSADDPLVTVKDKGYILAIDKTLGNMVLYAHAVRPEQIISRIKHYKEIVGRSEPPHCECGVEPEGTSGNIKLDTRASYSAYKHLCFPELRTFIYSKGPVYLTHVARTPDVLELHK